MGERRRGTGPLIFNRERDEKDFGGSVEGGLIHGCCGARVRRAEGGEWFGFVRKKGCERGEEKRSGIWVQEMGEGDEALAGSW